LTRGNVRRGGVLAQLQDASGQNVLIGQYTQPTVGVITAVTSVSSGTTTTIYTVNTPAAGQYVTFSGLTTATALNGQTLLVLTVNAGVSFTVASSVATQGETADTGQFAIVIGPDDMEIHSVAGSGYIYQYNKANATVQVFEVPAAASLSAVEPLQESGSSIPSGVYGDTVHFVATWVRN